MRKVLLIFFLILNCELNAQSKDSLKNYLNKKVEIIRRDNLVHILNEDEPYYEFKYYPEVYKFSKLLLKDKNVSVKISALETIINIAYHNDKYIDTTISTLLEKYNDREIRKEYDVIKPMTYYKKDFFTKHHYNQINSLFSIDLNPSRNLILLIGFLNLKEHAPRLKQLIQENQAWFDGAEKRYLKDSIRGNIPVLPRTDKYVVYEPHLALARMGDTAEINYCINKLKNLHTHFDIKDNNTYGNIEEAVFKDEFIYLKIPELFQYYYDLLKGNQNWNCMNLSLGYVYDFKYKILSDILPALIRNPIPKFPQAEYNKKGNYEYFAKQWLEECLQWLEQNKNNIQLKTEYWNNPT